MSVSSHFKPGTQPFSVRAGPMRPTTGEGEFVEYGSVAKLRATIESTFTLPVSYRLVFGSYGSGKTWAFSWLWRELSREAGTRKCFVIGIPRFEIRARPERSLVESVLREVYDRQPTLYNLAVSSDPARASDDLRSVQRHFQNPDSRRILAGIAGSSRVKSHGDARSFSLTRSDDLSRLLLATFEAVRLAGYPRCLVLVDELEAPFLLGSKKDRIIFSEFLRGIYDSLSVPGPGGAQYPSVQFLFSGTWEVYQQFWPEAITKQLESGTLMSAFIRRTEKPFLLNPPSDTELETIAKSHIENARRKPEGGWIPFDRDAIDMAWKRSGRNLGQFLHVTSDMYRLAEAADAKRVTKAHCEQALAAYGEGEE
jgi:hypothetical protein